MLIRELQALSEAGSKDRQDLGDLIDEWEKENKTWHYEGQSGVRTLERLVEILDSDYNSIESFLADNQGAMLAIVDWIKNDANVPEWAEAMQQHIKNSEK